MDSSQPIFTGADDALHLDALGDEWWATETAWFSFHHVERRLGGWFYSMFRPNIGTVAGGAWIWDDTAHLPWEVPYSANYTALELSPDLDLTDCVLPTGVSMRVIDPTMCYALRFDDGERLQADLTFTGIMPPEPLTGSSSTFGKASHFDQFGRVQGRLTLHGETIDIDCIGMRDRTWGRRPENRPRQAAYVTGAVNADQGFLAVTNTTPEGDAIAYGFLRRDGETRSFRGGERETRRDKEHGWINEVIIRGVDEAGREINAIGTPMSRIIINRHTFIDINTLIEWDIDGARGWGEDQDMWPVHRWSRIRRSGRRDL
ncbi:MAG: DUF7065 domain-containing protein [Gammaproteobacteria bacterium]